MSSDEVHRETIEIDMSQPEVSEDETLLKQRFSETVQVIPDQPQKDTYEIDIRFPQQEPSSTTTTIVHESATSTQVTSQYVDESAPIVMEGGDVHKTTLVMRKGEEAAPIQMKVQLPVQPETAETVSHLTEATTTVVSEITSVPIEDITDEVHTETIEITQGEKQQPQEIRFQIPSTERETEISEVTEMVKSQAQRIEVEIHEQVIHKEPQPQEITVDLRKVSRTEVDIDIQPDVQTTRPSEEKIEETRTMITKETKVIEVSAPELETTVETREIIELEEPSEVPSEESEITVELAEVPKEEVTFEVPQQTMEIAESEETDVKEVITHVEDIAPEVQKEEIVLDIKGKAEEEVAFTFQIAPEEDTQEEEEKTFTSEVEVQKTETVEAEEHFRDEISFDIKGKEQQMEEVQFTLKVEETPDEEVTTEEVEKAPVVEETSTAEQIIEFLEEGQAPEFTWGLISLKVMDGEEVKFRCEVIGKPMPEISWFHDDVPIAENQDFKLTYDMESGACTLLIVEVFPQDAGEYRCEAVNIHGKAVTRAILEIECK